MAQFQQFAVADGSTVQVNAQDQVISSLVEDDAGNILGDYTGANALHFPAVLATLTGAQRDAILGDMGVAQYILSIKAGIAT